VRANRVINTNVSTSALTRAGRAEINELKVVVAKPQSHANKCSPCMAVLWRAVQICLRWKSYGGRQLSSSSSSS